jgi:UDP-N-acetylmuramoyl-L-alanyl-D-glutamate--2,6-diaminopimelate ligase
MRLIDLFENTGENIAAEIREIEIKKISFDSRKVATGHLFIAVKGYQSDGHRFLKQAEEQGAVAAVVQHKNVLSKIPQIVVKDSRQMMGLLARNFYSREIEQLDLIGITGTNGKTTTSYLVQSVLQEAGISCGLVGTIHYIIGQDKINAWNTTPEAVDLYEMMSQMQKFGNKVCALEVSSHALALKRVAGLQFKAAVFTNLSRDHMDFHMDMENYFKDKEKLFDQLAASGTAIINNDDEYAKRLKEKHEKAITFGTNNQALVYATEWNVSRYGTHLFAQTPQGKVEINSNLVGDFNVYNLLTALSVGLAMDIPLPVIKQGLENVKSVPGRLEAYPLTNHSLALIDYAHTPDALEKALTASRKITTNRLRVVFGCGGDRDRGKRPQMGRIAQKLADVVYVTDDNPRTENRKKIIDDILQGMRKSNTINVVYDRREAIRQAVQEANKGDVVLVAGKGHENYQILGTVKYDFDEAAIIREADNNA